MIRTRLFSQPQGLIGILGSSYGALGKSSSNGLGVLNHSTGSISVYNPAQNNNVSVHHASPSPLVAQPSILSLAPPPAASANMNSKELSINQVIVSGPSTTRKGSNNKSITLLNANSVNHRMSVFEPSIRDTIQHFSEKHLVCKYLNLFFSLKKSVLRVLQLVYLSCLIFSIINSQHSCS